MGVHFYFLAPTPLRDRKRLKRFLHWLCESESRSIDTLTIIFCSDDYLLNINKQYLNHDYFTDIITFDLMNTSGVPIVGEIYISIDRVRENAGRFGISIASELHRVLFHGLLHLCDYKDKKQSDKALMTNKENHYLHHYLDVPRGS